MFLSSLIIFYIFHFKRGFDYGKIGCFGHGLCSGNEVFYDEFCFDAGGRDFADRHGRRQWDLDAVRAGGDRSGIDPSYFFVAQAHGPHHGRGLADPHDRPSFGQGQLYAAASYLVSCVFDRRCRSHVPLHAAGTAFAGTGHAHFVPCSDGRRDGTAGVLAGDVF